MKKIFVALFLSILIISPILVGAQVPDPSRLISGDVDSIEDVKAKIDLAASWLQYILWALAVVFIILGAFTYLTAAGEAEKQKKAKGYILGAVIAIIVALLAKGLITVVGNFFGANL